MVKTFASLHCGEGAISVPFRLVVEFVVGSRFAVRDFFPGYPVFLPALQPAKADVTSSLNLVCIYHTSE